MRPHRRSARLNTPKAAAPPPPLQAPREQEPGPSNPVAFAPPSHEAPVSHASATIIAAATVHDPHPGMLGGGEIHDAGRDDRAETPPAGIAAEMVYEDGRQADDDPERHEDAPAPAEGFGEDLPDDMKAEIKGIVCHVEEVLKQIDCQTEDGVVKLTTVIENFRVHMASVRENVIKYARDELEVLTRTYANVTETRRRTANTVEQLRQLSLRCRVFQ